MLSSLISFVSYEDVLVIHDEIVIAIYGGKSGIRYQSSLEACVERPKQYHFYEGYEIPEIAAVYMFGINDGHVFTDGNKRTSLLVSELFLRINGYQLTASSEELEDIALRIADNKSSLDECCKFMRKYALSL